MLNDTVIVDGVRSPRARARDTGALHELTPQQLLKQLYNGLEARTGLEPERVNEVILGCVTQHGEQAGNIARTSLLYAGWPDHVPGLTVHRFCSSSIDAIALGALKIAAGQFQQVVAGGVEMMSRAPMMSDKARVFLDPEFGQAARMLLMGNGADLIASREGISRSQVDEVALESQRRAFDARAAGHFNRSILPIDTPAGEATEDECIRPGTSLDSLSVMDPAFADLGAAGADDFQLQHNPQLERINHVHTMGNSPAMADAAGLLLLCDRKSAMTMSAPPRARIAASITVAADPLQVLTGCIEATTGLLAQEGLTTGDIDLFEIHEAFAATSVLAKRRLDVGSDRFNVNGGCIALGHPMGATGAIMTLTLLDELERRDLRRGIVAAAGAAGSGSALLIDRQLA